VEHGDRLVGKLLMKRRMGRPGLRWEDYIEMNLGGKVINECTGFNWLTL
jgi:hypothetical protein